MDNIAIPGLDPGQTKDLLDGLREQLFRLEGHQDDVLLEYMAVLLGNRHGRQKMVEELKAFLSTPAKAEALCDWIFRQSCMSRLSHESQQAHDRPLNNPMGRHLERSFDRHRGAVYDKHHPQHAHQTRLQHAYQTRLQDDPQGRHRLSVKSIVLTAASVSKPARNGPGRVFRSVIDSALRKDPNRMSDEEVRDARDIINAARRRPSVDDEGRLGSLGERCIVNADPNDVAMHDEPENVPNQQMAVYLATPKKCPQFPNCPLANGECPNVHPNELCKYFPNCMYGKDCLYVHPAYPCRFAERCINPSCNFAHFDKTDHASSTAAPAASNNAMPTTSTPFPNPLSSKSSILCKFGGRCRRPDCPFMHPIEAPCPHGAQCMRPACPFTHPSDHPPPPPRSLVNRPCRFGRNCAKADCPFLHPERQSIVTNKANE